MKRIVKALLLGLGMAASLSTSAAERPMVAVAFDLAVPRWKQQFVSRQGELEQSAAKAIASWLGKEMGFVGFVAGDAGARRLIVHLEVVPDSGVSPYKETQLRLELVGQSPAMPIVWRFRPDVTYADPTINVESFVREIELRLKDMDKQALVRQVLSRVPIAGEARLWKDPVGWVIPYRRSELCMDFRSMLRIENMLPSGAGPVLKEFMARASGDFAPQDGAAAGAELRGRLFTVPLPAQEGLADLGSVNPAQVTVQAVYVVEYQPLQACGVPFSPDAVDFRGGSR
jgi:hypothetical protein